MSSYHEIDNLFFRFSPVFQLCQTIAVNVIRFGCTIHIINEAQHRTDTVRSSTGCKTDVDWQRNRLCLKAFSATNKKSSHSNRIITRIKVNFQAATLWISCASINAPHYLICLCNVICSPCKIHLNWNCHHLIIGDAAAAALPMDSILVVYFWMGLFHSIQSRYGTDRHIQCTC